MIKQAALAAICLAALSGCASEYLIITDDGSVLTSDGKPELDKDTGMLEYEDGEGRKQQVQPQKVKQIIER
ncbi:YgdI/YgdR family lipoprotein [Metapseudomonas furukawaii]|uniref:Hypothetical lipoprotein ygdR n=1 Tax=Metapseudomonas furukawaii TaxID=1149133 RepID=A0AAD1BXI1_METFU|nr:MULTISPECIES: YgdI/YgdR family lipoprotein [Pseudomonas]ELS28908.1 protein of unknown function DUF903 [Pseudomonas furukawaii]OWJ94829.1 YgdI/YgdR family lipoprotein [Pseudomonas sp. A46]WAG80844.1 YgdI/YgdR family lipoprotein [Pseudomonas furukawaii]BAU73684.1 hypothetical lipoprotein ygdR precursor [Pseudomonas furukawaii]